MKNISDHIDEVLERIRELDAKLDKVIKANEPPEDVIQLFRQIREDNKDQGGMGRK